MGGCTRSTWFKASRTRALTVLRARSARSPNRRCCSVIRQGAVQHRGAFGGEGVAGRDVAVGVGLFDGLLDALEPGLELAASPLVGHRVGPNAGLFGRRAEQGSARASSERRTHPAAPSCWCCSSAARRWARAAFGSPSVAASTPRWCSTAADAAPGLAQPRPAAGAVAAGLVTVPLCLTCLVLSGSEDDAICAYASTNRVSEFTNRSRSVLEKRVMVVSAAIFVLGSLVAAWSSSLTPFLLGRALQGVAMGYIPVAISMVREIAPAKRRAGAVAAVSATLGVGGALGLPLSAWIAEDYSWHGLFWLSAVLAAVILGAHPCGRARHPRRAPGSHRRRRHLGPSGWPVLRADRGQQRLGVRLGRWPHHRQHRVWCRASVGMGPVRAASPRPPGGPAHHRASPGAVHQLGRPVDRVRHDGTVHRCAPAARDADGHRLRTWPVDPSSRLFRWRPGDS